MTTFPGLLSVAEIVAECYRQAFELDPVLGAAIAIAVVLLLRHFAAQRAWLAESHRTDREAEELGQRVDRMVDSIRSTRRQESSRESR